MSCFLQCGRQHPRRYRARCLRRAWSVPLLALIYLSADAALPDGESGGPAVYTVPEVRAVGPAVSVFLAKAAPVNPGPVLPPGLLPNPGLLLPPGLSLHPEASLHPERPLNPVSRLARAHPSVLVRQQRRRGAIGGFIFASETDEKLKRCRYLHRRIEHYTRLRRGGGDGAQMERWRRSRQRYEEEYRRKRCYRFGRKLTPIR